MSKVHTVQGGTLSHIFFCPACNCGHGFNVEPNKSNGVGGTVPVWTFNGDFEKPTVRASILVRHYRNPPVDPETGDFAKDEQGSYLIENGKLKGGKDIMCHSFITDGKIQFLDDCTHELRGQTVDLEDF